MHTSNTEQNSKDNSMEWLLEELRLLKAGANIDTDVDIKQAHNSIRSHLLADVMRVIGEDKEPLSNDEIAGDSVCLNCDYFLEWEGDPIRCRCGDHNDFKVQLRQAFNELLGGDKK